MKITFFLFAFAFILLIVFYISLRGWQALQSFNNIRNLYLILNFVLFGCLLLGLIGQETLPAVAVKIITFIGFSYLLIVIYLLLSFLIFDILRLSNLVFNFSSSGLKLDSFKWFFASIVLILISMLYGNYKFNHPEVVNIHISSYKPLQNKVLRIVAASDLHLGLSIDKNKLKKYVQLINDQKPDIILLLGDISDRSTQPLINQNMADEFSSFKAPFGVYAISGNHEYYSEDKFATANYLKTAGIIVLRDSSVIVQNSIYIVGRDDKTNTNRKQLSDLTKDLDYIKPMIILDHQPFNLKEAQNNGADLQLSGHTHNGQFFPGNLFVKNMFEIGYGYKKIGKTHYYVSSGLGLWGPQYRIGTQSEIVVIDFKY